MTQKCAIFKYQDNADACRIPIWVCVCIEHSADDAPHAHLTQAWISELPKDLADFLEQSKNGTHNGGQVVLSVADFPKLTREINAAVKRLKA
jgi:hypothetical protein